MHAQRDGATQISSELHAVNEYVATHYDDLIAFNFDFWPSKVLQRNDTREARAIQQVASIREAVNCQPNVPDLEYASVQRINVTDY